MLFSRSGTSGCCNVETSAQANTKAVPLKAPIGRMTDIAIGIVMQRPVGMLQGLHFCIGQSESCAVEDSKGKAGTKEQKCYELFHDEHLKIYVVSVWG